MPCMRLQVDLYRAHLKAEEVYTPPDNDYEKNSCVMTITPAERCDRLQAYLASNRVQSPVSCDQIGYVAKIINAFYGV